MKKIIKDIGNKQSETQDLKNQLARALADYDNFKKRSEEERKLLYRFASTAIILKLLPILDNLRSALSHVSDSGIAIIVGQLENIFKEEGFLEIILKKGDVFDENLAEAVDVVETEDQKFDNTISEVLLTGWRYKEGEVVRHTKVKVFKYNK